jgi:hypothetical protein
MDEKMERNSQTAQSVPYSGGPAGGYEYCDCAAVPPHRRVYSGPFSAIRSGELC